MSASQQKKLRQQQREQGTEKRQVAQKKEAKQAKKGKAIAATVWTVLVVAVLAAVLFSSNLFYHTFPAVTIGDTSYNASELSFIYKSTYFNFVNTYGDYLQYMNLDTTKSLSSQAYSDTQTWADNFREQAISALTEITAMCAAADEAGFTLTDEQLANIDAEFETLKETAKSGGFSSVNAFLSANYGKGCNEKLVRALIEKTTLADAYAASKYDSFTYSDSELDAHYDENKDKFDKFTYISYKADGAANEEIGLDSETAMVAAKAVADLIVRDATTEEDFIASISSHAQAEASRSSTQGANLDSAYSEWMLDPSRKEGDMTVIEGTDGYYALYFISRERNDGKTVSARHILTYALPDENGKYTDEAKAEALKTSEDILAQWKAGDATEESFAALANEKSEDTGSNTNGGLYENFLEGRMVEEYDAWCFDPARKPGDTGIVFNEDSNYCGYHVVYFVGTGVYDKVLAENDIRSADYTEWKTAATEGYAATTGFTAKLVK